MFPVTAVLDDPRCAQDPRVVGSSPTGPTVGEAMAGTVGRPAAMAVFDGTKTSGIEGLKQPFDAGGPQLTPRFNLPEELP